MKLLATLARHKVLVLPGGWGVFHPALPGPSHGR